jgi:hypothetical protein
MNNKMLLMIVVVGCLLLLLAVQKGFPLLLVLPLVIPFFWHGRKE